MVKSKRLKELWNNEEYRNHMILVHRKNKNHIDEQKVIELYLEGLSIEKIAKKLNICKSGTFKVIKKEGISRPAGFQKGNQLGLGMIHTKEAREKISKALKGKKKPPISEETRNKLSIANKGKKMPESAKRKISEYMKQHKRTEEHCRNLSLSHIGLQALEKHPNWQGGKSFEEYGIEFNNKLKEQIRKRDDYICQECNYTQEELGYKLTVHHINYDKMDNDPENLIALCKGCHGKTNYNRENWTDYYQNKIIKDEVRE